VLIKFDQDEQLSQLDVACNTGDAALFSNVAAACALGLPEIDSYDAVEQPAVVVGGGPSLAASLESIREMQQHGARIFALNNTARYLLEHGIQPDVQVVLDPRPGTAAFVTEHLTGELLICSQCHPATFAAARAAGYPMRLWHPVIEGIEAVIGKPEPLLIGGGLTVGLSGLCLIYTLGHRQMHLFGYDSCHGEAGNSHAYPQGMNDADDLVRVAVDNKVFMCSLTMAAQAGSFQRVVQMLANLDCAIHVHGEGLVPHLVKKWQREAELRVVTAVYDLAYSPPTYDFLTFLVEAERYRKREGFARIDVTFMPGPMWGFRDDQLPPDAATRRGMLWRVCVPMAKLLPSVRNVTVLEERAEVKNEVFPPEYEEQRPLARYGAGFSRGAWQMLEASEYARRRAARLFPYPYATISLRQASYWPERNSNIEAWLRVAAWLWRQDIWPVFIPDTEGAAPEGFGACEPAAWDLDLRAALYEGARVNLGVSNGPMTLLPFLKARYLTFKILTPSATATTPEFLAAHGFAPGDSPGGDGRWVWAEDDYETIIEQLQEFAKPALKEIAQ